MAALAQMEPESTHDILLDCWQQAQGDPHEAELLMLAATDPDTNLETFIAVMGESRRRIIHLMIRGYAHRERRKVWDGEVPKVPSTPAAATNNQGLRLLGESNLYDFTLSSGIRLGDAAGRELDSTIAMYGAAEVQNGRRRFWLSMIRDRVKDDQIVREVLSVADLKRLQTEALTQIV